LIVQTHFHYLFVREQLLSIFAFLTHFEKFV
jgi:hypothetical protein